MKRINFETAKLAKEAGYDYQESNGIYWSDGKFDHEEKYVFYKTVAYPAPYQAELQEWLIREHGIYVIVAPRFYGDYSVWHVNEVIDILNNTLETLNSNLFRGIFSMYVTYEDALEEGLIQALKMLLK